MDSVHYHRMGERGFGYLSWIGGQKTAIWNSRGLIRITVIECDRRTHKPLSALVDRFGDSDHRPDEWFDGFWVVTGVSTTFFGVAPGKLFESFDDRICISTGKGCFLD